MAGRISRRRFVRHATVAGSTAFWFSTQSSRLLSNSPNQRVAVAGIGVGGKGSSDIGNAAKYGQVVAICDIDDVQLRQQAKLYPDAATFHDFRELLSVMGDKVDAVTVSTADHTHAAAGVAAMRLGKHVYCQKPLTHSVSEARLMRETARQFEVVTQMGNQGTSHDGFRANVELVRSGALGDVREVHVWTNRPFRDWEKGVMFWKQAPDLTSRPADTPPVPPHIKWDLWLGPAPTRPYHSVYHPHDWRGWWDFGTGALGDMACHTAAMPFMALDLGLPDRVHALSGEVNAETYPAWATVTYEFPARGDKPPVRLVWYEGAENGKRNLPTVALPGGEIPTPSGSLLVGDQGRLYSPGDSGNTRRLDVAGPISIPEQTIERLGGRVSTDENQKREWIRGIQGGAAPLSNFDFSSVLTETMLLGNVAVRMGRPIHYNGDEGSVTNHSEASSLISRRYRDGWEL